jgi:anthranilate synthase/aminodeoxychorismate synthase-like glutamine amidotransferase
MILVVDNYDSFTYNLVGALKELKHQVLVMRNDDEQLRDLAERPDAIILSPGPGRPEQAGYLLEIVDRYHDQFPILGICLGHQALGIYFGAELVKAPRPMHGKRSNLKHAASSLFNDIGDLEVMRYHSLVLNEAGRGLEVMARSTDDDTIQAIQHQQLPLCGFQFHPESIGTANGKELIGNWLNEVGL